MTREELKIASTEKLISALEYCGRDSYYATYYDEVVSEIRDRLNQLTEKDKQIEELKKENEEWKTEWNDQVIKANEEGFARTQLQIKNKELEADNDARKFAMAMSEKVEKKLREENAELKEQIDDVKDFVLKVSKFLHNNYNIRPDQLVYKERAVLLIKELKLFEKWGGKSK